MELLAALFLYLVLKPVLVRIADALEALAAKEQA